MQATGGTVTETAEAIRSETTVERFAEKVIGDYAGANAFLMAGLGTGWACSRRWL
jgi:hypothetical protein